MPFIEAWNKYVILVYFLKLEMLEQAVNVPNTHFFLSNLLKLMYLRLIW